MKSLLSLALVVCSASCLVGWKDEVHADGSSASSAQEKGAKKTDAPSDGGQVLARIGDGKPVCGLGKAFHAGRRAELMKRVGDELLVFRGLPGSRDNLAFRQDKTFWYLTGVESPEAALVLDGKSKKEILFLPARNERAEGWDGELWDDQDQWVKDLTGFTEVRPNDKLVETLEDLLDGRKKIGTTLGASFGLSGSYDSAGPYDEAQEKDPLDGRPSREKALAAKLAAELDVEVFDVNETLVDMRRIKAPEEIAAMRRAAHVGSLAHIEAMRSSRPGLGEWELDALMTFVQVREGAYGKAYEAIVGSAGNACILHYTDNARRMGPGEVVLIDYGPEVDHYTTDITRSWPVDGKFSKRAAELYDAVLAAQKAGIAAAKPGVTIRDVDKACSAVLKERGLIELRKHGACHFIGMEVHDPGDYQKPVEPGVAFTIEPGLYDTEAGIGIRIEDVVVITPDGCEVISALAPKERADLEKLVGEEGVLDRMEKSQRN